MFSCFSNSFQKEVKNLKFDREVQRLVDSYGIWVQSDKDNCPGHAARMTKELFPYDAIFSPIRVNRLTLKNRVVMAPMGNLNMCEENGRPNDKMLQYFFARAKGCLLYTSRCV